MTIRYWASRTSRGHNDYFWSELQEGRLRQGWGYDQSQDLRQVAKLDVKDQSAVQRETFRHRHMLGKEGGWQNGDIVLVPNMPEQGMFALVKVTGPYRFQIDHKDHDFGHIREVELLTKQGVANTNPYVDSELRSTLRNAGRAWEIRGRDAAIMRILEHANDESMIAHSTNMQRTASVLAQALDTANAALLESFTEGLHGALGKAEWEGVIASALSLHFPTGQIKATGGPREQGADLVVELPNPFGGEPWIIVIQVKDYRDEVGAEVIGQLEQAITAYSEADGEPRQVIQAVLASTQAKASPAFEECAAKLTEKTGVPVSVISGKELMDLILRGILHSGIEQSIRG
ncbi:hypothetical protein E1162_01510 [Rhodobacteraceae bacterium RKSG542]|uniref:restriction endonuclease n=1 Tax=Pseudovibrio flavus TaxID=2529854 RepID=UPI0012BBECD1|nr:restriction endonuclease [Pseudovibrio flavus]MTI15911.1 hypothetical protein [Pseudovibrio flavus]